MTKPHDYADDTDDGNDHKNDNDTGSTPDRTSMANKNRPKIDEKTTESSEKRLGGSKIEVWRRLGGVHGRLGASWKHFRVSWGV